MGLGNNFFDDLCVLFLCVCSRSGSALSPSRIREILWCHRRCIHCSLFRVRITRERVSLKTRAHDQLVLHVIRSDKVLHDILGKDMRFILSDLQRDRFIATSPKTKQSRSLGNAVGDFHEIHLTILATTPCPWLISFSLDLWRSRRGTQTEWRSTRRKFRSSFAIFCRWRRNGASAMTWSLMRTLRQRRQSKRESSWTHSDRTSTRSGSGISDANMLFLSRTSWCYSTRQQMQLRQFTRCCHEQI